MSIRNSTKERSEQEPRIKVKFPLEIPIVEEMANNSETAGHIEQLKQIVELLDDIKRKADDANNAVVGLVKVITAFHL